MRVIFSLLVVLVSIGIAGNSSAQTNDSNNVLQIEKKLFDPSYPSSISFPVKEIDKLFKLDKGNSFSMSSSERTVIAGTVINILINPDGSKSISLKPNSFHEGTRMVLSVRAIKGKNEYKGFILNYQYPDAYKITSSENDIVIFSQLKRKEIIEE